MAVIGCIYLLHFARPVGNPASPRGQARHYLGWALDPERRNADHQAGRGAALTRAAVDQGIAWDLFILGDGDRALERRIKQLKATPRLCPICGRSHRGGRLHIPQAHWGQLELDLFDPFDVPTPSYRMDWMEIASIRNANRCGFHGAVGDVALPDIPY